MSVLISEAEIAVQVDRLADAISAYMPPDFTAVILMDGAMVFATDLLRALYAKGINSPVCSLGLSSYGASRETSGEVKVTSDLTANLKGRAVLLIDDVLESGHTLSFAKTYVTARGAKPVSSCVFAQKPYDKPLATADFVGWSAPDRFLIGYGLDDKGRFRGQPFISAAD